MAHQYASGDPTDRGRACIPTLKTCQPASRHIANQVAESKMDKSRLLQEAFFPRLERDDLVNPDHNYPAPKFSFKSVTNKQIHRVIARLSPFKPPDQTAPPTSSSHNVQTYSCPT